MKKEYTWDVTIDGENHRVSCNLAGNKYQIWVDDEELTVVYRQNHRQMRNGLEREFSIGGKKCLFVVWDEKPDLVVEGMLLKSGKDYFQEKAKRKKIMLTATWFMLAFGIAILGYVIVSLCVGGWNNEAVSWRRYSLYVLAAFWIIVDATFERIRLKEQ